MAWFDGEERVCQAETEVAEELKKSFAEMADAVCPGVVIGSHSDFEGTKQVHVLDFIFDAFHSHKTLTDSLQRSGTWKRKCSGSSLSRIG